MSLYDYQRSLAIAQQDEPFYALIMAAMRKADTLNVIRLRTAWPEVWAELQDRYHAPGGVISGDPECQERTNLVRTLQDGDRIIP